LTRQKPILSTIIVYKVIILNWNGLPESVNNGQPKHCFKTSSGSLEPVKDGLKIWPNPWYYNDLQHNVGQYPKFSFHQSEDNADFQARGYHDPNYRDDLVKMF
jgi:hypothetical protein